MPSERRGWTFALDETAKGLVEPMQEKTQPPDREEDAELVRRAALGEEPAFEALIRRKRERVFWIAYRIVGDEEDARDIAQATFVRLWKVLGKYRPDQSFDTWLYRITVNLAIDHYRSRGPARDTIPLREGEEPRIEASARGAPSGDPLEALAGAELRRIFGTLAARLGEKQRAIFVLSQIEGMPTEQIAKIMGVTHSTVRNHLFQARRSLQEGMRLLYPEYYRAATRQEKGKGERSRE